MTFAGRYGLNIADVIGSISCRSIHFGSSSSSSFSSAEARFPSVAKPCSDIGLRIFFVCSRCYAVHAWSSLVCAVRCSQQAAVVLQRRISQRKSGSCSQSCWSYSDLVRFLHCYLVLCPHLQYRMSRYFQFLRQSQYLRNRTARRNRNRRMQVPLCHQPILVGFQ